MNRLISNNPILRFKYILKFQEGGKYKVKKGDTLSKIAKLNGIKLRELLKLNPNIKNPDRIYVGLTINLSSNSLIKDKVIKTLKFNTPLYAGMISTPILTYTPWKPELPAGGICNTKECAKWANDSLRNYKDSKGRILYSFDNIGGDAWTRLSSGKNSKMVFSGYEGIDYDPTTYSEEASNRRNWDAADRFLREFDSKTLDKNKTYLVNMYYNGSHKKKDAWEGALNGTTGTHTGNVYWNPKTNSWRVAHNIYGVLHDDDFILTQGSKNKYGITAIAEAPMIDYSRRDWEEAHPIKAAINKVYDFGMWKLGGRLVKAQSGTVLPEVTVTSINPNNKGFTSSDMKQYVRAINRNRNFFMNKYNLTDLDFADLAKFAVNAAGVESSYGANPWYTRKKYTPDLIIQYEKGKLRGKDNVLPVSRGLTLIKYGLDVVDSPTLKYGYRALGITDRGLNWDPNLMARATLYRAKYINDLIGDKDYHYTDGTVIPKDNKLSLYWNFGRLTDYANGNPNTDSDEGAVNRDRGYNSIKIIK